MATESAIYKIPAPVDADVPNGPAQMKAIADTVDAIKWTSQSLKPSLPTAEASAKLNAPGEVSTDVPGVAFELTPSVASLLLVWVDLAVTFSANQTVYSFLNIDGVDPTFEEASWHPTNFGTSTGNQMVIHWHQIVPLSAAKHTIKLRARNSGFVVQKVGTRMSGLLLAT